MFRPYYYLYTILVVFILFVSSLSTRQSFAQESTNEETKDWALDLSVQQYFLPDAENLAVPMVSFYWSDYLVEARYNYESKDAASVWVGYPITLGSSGETVEAEITPLVGTVFGTVEGMAPGLKLDMNWHRFNLYSELEYVFDFEARENNFFYSWSELTVTPVEWLSLGIVGSRTRVYDTSVELDRGPIVRFNLDSFSLSCTVLNVDHDPIVIIGADYSL